MTDRSDEFTLYDLDIVVEQINGQCTCAMAIGDRFHLRGGKLSLPDGADFCLYAFNSVLPLLPAKQRQNHPADRVAPRTLRHDDVSATPWESVPPRE